MSAPSLIAFGIFLVMFGMLFVPVSADSLLVFTTAMALGFVILVYVLLSGVA